MLRFLERMKPHHTIPTDHDITNTVPSALGREFHFPKLPTKLSKNDSWTVGPKLLDTAIDIRKAGLIRFGKRPDKFLNGTSP